MCKLKLLFLISISSATLLIQNVVILLLLLLFLILSSYLLDKKKQIIDRLFPLLFIALFIVTFHLLFNTSINIQARILAGIKASLKITVLSSSVLIYTLTTSLSETIASISFLPRKIQLLLTITFSSIPVLLNESHRITMAQNSRGYQTNFFNIAKNITPIIIPLLHRTLIRAEQIAVIMFSRGYNED